VAFHHAVQRVQPARHQLQQRRLARPVGPDNGDPGVQVDAQVDVRVQDFVLGVPERHVGELEHGRRQLAHVGEGQAHDGLALHLLRQPAPHHLLQRLLLGLRLAGQLGGPVPEPGDVLLHVRDLVLLPLVLLHLGVLELGPRPAVGVIIAAVRLQGLLLHVDDVGAHPVHEVLGVRDQQEDARELGERVLQPHARLQVQVVGRLVQDKQARVHEQRAREGDAHAPAP